MIKSLIDLLGRLFAVTQEYIRQSIQEWIFKSGLSKFCGRQLLKNLKEYHLLYDLLTKFFKGCLPQN